MNQIKRIQGLNDITQMRKEADQLKLAKLQNQVQSLRNSLKDLNVQRLGHNYEVENGQDSAAFAIADLNWQVWVDQRLRKINAELAQALAQVEECQATLQQSFGRDLAASALLRRVEAVHATVSKRRTSYES